jgi:cysteinyl-tRNA synthetase
MSKSLGNVLLVHELIETLPGEVIRLALLSAHYRQPLDWSDETVDAARRMLDRLYGALRGIEIDPSERAAAAPPEAVIGALEDDLNTPRALAEVFNVVRELNRSDDAKTRHRLALEVAAAGDLLGLLQESPDAWFAGHDDAALPASEIEKLLGERESARTRRDFSAADAIRDRLNEAGVSIEDGPGGTRWRRIG